MRMGPPGGRSLMARWLCVHPACVRTSAVNSQVRLARACVGARRQRGAAQGESDCMGELQVQLCIIFVSRCVSCLALCDGGCGVSSRRLLVGNFTEVILPSIKARFASKKDTKEAAKASVRAAPTRSGC